MKSIFYVGAALMLGASVYGFVDYRKAKSQKEFNELYGSDKTSTGEITKPEIAVFEEKEPVMSGTEEKTEPTIKKTSTFVQDEKPSSETVSEKVAAKSSKVTGDKKKNKHSKKKKLSSKLFSRAAPMVEFTPPAIKVDEITPKPAHQ